jgi:ribosome-associated protein
MEIKKIKEDFFMSATSKELAKIAYAALEEKKANDIKVIDISGVSVLADYFIIASGSNRNQVQAMVDSVQEDLYKKAGLEAKQVEGYQTGSWILLDYADIIVHVFDEENRLFYNLERIWRDGKDISIEEL